MRVIAGSCKGQKLKGPKGRETRPTMDRVREAIFNVIAEEIEDSHFLDIFAGSGAVGIEALSRGAKSLALIEKNRAALCAIRENLALTGFKAETEIVAKDVMQALKYLAEKKESFEIVFMDPPYDSVYPEQVMEALDKLKLLLPGGLLVLETSKAEETKSKGRLVREKQKIYGDTKVNFYRMTGRLESGNL